MEQQQSQPSVGLPYVDDLEEDETADDGKNNAQSTTITDRHSPSLPNREPYDVQPEIVSLSPTGRTGTSGADDGDSSLGLPFMIVIGASAFLVLTGVILAARKFRNKDDADDEDEEDISSDKEDNDGNNDLEAMENANVTKGAAAAANSGKQGRGKPAMDFTSIIAEEEKNHIGDVSTHMVDSSMDTTSTTTAAAITAATMASANADGGDGSIGDDAVPPGLLGDDGEGAHDENDNVMMLTI